MESGAKLHDHSIHQIIIVLPLGLLSAAIIFDFIHLLGGSQVFGTVAYWMIASGLVSGLVAGLFGWLDLRAVPAGSRARSIGALHSVVNSIVLLLFAASLYFRAGNPEHPELIVTVLSTVGAGFALIGGCLGSELVGGMDAAHAVPEGSNTLSITRITSARINPRAAAIAIRRQAL